MVVTGGSWSFGCAELEDCCCCCCCSWWWWFGGSSSVCVERVERARVRVFLELFC